MLPIFVLPGTSGQSVQSTSSFLVRHPVEERHDHAILRKSPRRIDQWPTRSSAAVERSANPRRRSPSPHSMCLLFLPQRARAARERSPADERNSRIRRQPGTCESSNSAGLRQRCRHPVDSNQTANAGAESLSKSNHRPSCRPRIRLHDPGHAQLIGGPAQLADATHLPHSRCWPG